MDAASATSSIQQTQQALSVIALLNLTGFMYPPMAEVKNGSTFDYIVVGAGTAGSVIASRITEDPNNRVLLIEAGGDPPLENTVSGLWLYNKNSSSDWSFPVGDDADPKMCHKKGSVKLSAGKMLGGTSAFYYFLYARGNSGDYDKWAATTKDKTWEWKHVLPYFIKSENMKDPKTLKSIDRIYHGTKGNLAVTKDVREETEQFLAAVPELGYKVVPDLNGHQSVGFSRPAFVNDGLRQNAAYSFLGPSKDRPNLFVLKNTLVSKILFDSQKNAIGVQAIDENDSVAEYKAGKEVIVSAGAINSPKLLMLSGIGPKELLKERGVEVISDLPVGQNYQDHIEVLLFQKVKKEPKPIKSIDPLVVQFPKFIGYVALNQSKYPDYRALSVIIDDETLLQLSAFTYQFKDEISEYLYKSAKDMNVVFTMVTKLNPKSRGQITLHSTNPRDCPKIDTGFFSNKEDLDDTVTYIQDVLRVVNTTVYKKMGAELVDPVKSEIKGCKEYEYGSREYWGCYALCSSTPMGHVTGTCAMGSVVDGNLRVIGVKRLRVADGSIMPTIVSDSPGAATVMIGEKAADFIKDDNKAKNIFSLKIAL